MNHKQIEDYILSFPAAWLEFPFGEDVAVYKTGDRAAGEGKIFALIANENNSLRVTLKCDPQLSDILREKYETVLPGYHMNKKHWNTILATGQVGEDELFDLIRLSYRLVSGDLTIEAVEA